MTFDSLEANEASGQRRGLAPLQAAAIGWLLRVIDEQGRSADSPTPAQSGALWSDIRLGCRCRSTVQGASTLIWLWAQNFNSVSSFLLWCRYQREKATQIRDRCGSALAQNSPVCQPCSGSQVGASLNKKPSLLTLNWLVNRNIYVALWCSLPKAKWQPTRSSRRAANSQPLTGEWVLRPK